MRRLTVSKTNEQLISPLKTLIRKRASRCLLLKWSVKKFNLKYLHICSHIILTNMKGIDTVHSEILK
jgi:hypothetical protein